MVTATVTPTSGVGSPTTGGASGLVISAGTTDGATTAAGTSTTGAGTKHAVDDAAVTGRAVDTAAAGVAGTGATGAGDLGGVRVSDTVDSEQVVVTGSATVGGSETTAVTETSQAVSAAAPDTTSAWVAQDTPSALGAASMGIVENLRIHSIAHRVALDGVYSDTTDPLRGEFTTDAELDGVVRDEF